MMARGAGDQKSRNPVKRRVFSCKFSPQELLCHHTRLGYLDISGWDRFISSVMTQVMASLDSGPIRGQDGAKQPIRGLDSGAREERTCRKLRRVKRQRMIVNCNNNNNNNNKPQSEGVTLAMKAVKMATRRQTSLGLGIADLQQAMGLLVSLYMDVASALSLRVPSLQPASVQLATAAVLLRPGERPEERYSHATSLLCFLHLKLSLEAANTARPPPPSWPLIGPQCRHSDARAEVTRAEAERRLSHARPGTFLIRASETAASSLVLSVRSPGGCVHLRIEAGRGSGLQRGLVLGGHSPLFPDLASMMSYYSRTVLPIRGHGGGSILLEQQARQPETCV